MILGKKIYANICLSVIAEMNSVSISMNNVGMNSIIKE